MGVKNENISILMAKVLDYTEKLDGSNVKSIEDIFKQILKQNKKTYSSGNGKSFRVLDLVNPPLAFFRHTLAEEPPKPENLTKLFSYGKFIEGKVAYILEMKEPKFTVSQENVNGSNFNMGAVNGKIDFRIQDYIIELKTSEEDVSSESELLTEHPQDLEQLILYALFSHRDKHVHKLLYIVGRYPDIKVRTFKVKIKNAKKVEDYFVERLNKLKEAINTKSQENLGRCRYFDKGCIYQASKICNCSNENVINNKTLTEYIYIKLVDDELKGTLESKENLKLLPINFWDIFTPIRWFFKNRNPFEYISDETGDENLNLWRLRKKLEQELNKQNIFKLKQIDGQYSNIVPINEKIYFFNDSPIMTRVINKNKLNLNKLYIQELALICSLTNKNNGYLFICSININSGILYKIQFNNKFGEIQKKIETQLVEMNNSIKNDDYNELPLCIDFMREKKCFMDCYCKK